MQMKRKNKVWIVLGIILVVLLGAGIGGYSLIQTQASGAAAKLAFAPLDMSRVADGNYEGQADAGLVFARVSVTVKDHAIQSVDILEHRNGLGKKAEASTKDMIERNTYDVDVVSGATLSSRTIQSAVCQALSKGIK
jgi:uncharacterized protein with FMN-binding domain